MSWISLILGLVGLLRQFTTYLHDNKLFKAGEATAIATALQQASEGILKANQAEADAVIRHNTDKTDTAFDKEFERK